MRGLRNAKLRQVHPCLKLQGIFNNKYDSINSVGYFCRRSSGRPLNMRAISQQMTATPLLSPIPDTETCFLFFKLQIVGEKKSRLCSC